MFPPGNTLTVYTHWDREEEAGVKVYHSGWHLALVTGRDHASHLPLAGANPAIKIIDKNSKENDPVEMFEGGFATVSNRSHVLEHRFFSSCTTCCSPSCGLLCAGSPGGPSGATAGGRTLWRRRTQVITVSFTSVAASDDYFHLNQ